MMGCDDKAAMALPCRRRRDCCCRRCRRSPARDRPWRTGPRRTLIVREYRLLAHVQLTSESFRVAVPSLPSRRPSRWCATTIKIIHRRLVRFQIRINPQIQILQLIFHHSFYSLSFIIHSTAYLSSFILQHIFHHSFYSLSFIILVSLIMHRRLVRFRRLLLLLLSPTIPQKIR